MKGQQVGSSGYLQDEYTKLKPTADRIVSTSVTSTWKYSGPQENYHKAFDTVKGALASAFFGPPTEGVYSPSVQFTLHQMAQGALDAAPGVESIHLRMPNIHFLPCDPVNSEPFANDVYVATSEPCGDIEATIAREGVEPHFVFP
jgi:urate oxidase